MGNSTLKLTRRFSEFQGGDNGVVALHGSGTLIDSITDSDFYGTHKYTVTIFELPSHSDGSWASFKYISARVYGKRRTPSRLVYEAGGIVIRSVQ